MKVWSGFGSEHSMNLVMIGHFKEARDAEKAKELIELLTEQVNSEPEAYQREASPHALRFSKAMLDLLSASHLFSIGPGDLEQLLYSARISVDGSSVVITTDEIDVSVFLKVLLDKGARVEVYSAHDYPGTEHGRGR